MVISIITGNIVVLLAPILQLNITSMQTAVRELNEQVSADLFHMSQSYFGFQQ